MSERKDLANLVANAYASVNYEDTWTHIADAILASEWLKRHDEAVKVRAAILRGEGGE